MDHPVRRPRGCQRLVTLAVSVYWSAALPSGRPAAAAWRPGRRGRPVRPAGPPPPGQIRPARRGQRRPGRPVRQGPRRAERTRRRACTGGSSKFAADPLWVAWAGTSPRLPAGWPGVPTGKRGELVDLLLDLRQLLQRLVTAAGSVVALVTFSAGTWLLLERSVHTQYGNQPPQMALVF